jgi:RNA polymerase sigma-70 factor (ECF subfamily)
MSEDLSFEDLMARLRIGDSEVESQVFHRYAKRLIFLAQRHLEPRIQGKIDPDDVIQSVFRSFFTRTAAGQMEDLETWESLWQRLVIITLRKCRGKNDYYHTASREVQREIPLGVLANQSDQDWEPAAADPTPFEAAVLTETVERLMGQLERRNRQILTLCLQGFPIPEISTEVGCTERTVYRILERVKHLLEMMGYEN